MKKENQMMDALLSEHARKGAGDDTDFLESLEKRLDDESSVTSITAAQLDTQRSKLPTIGMGIAAALTVAAVGYYGWKDPRTHDLAINATHDRENEAKNLLSYRSRQVLPKKKREASNKPTTKDNVLGEIAVDKIARSESSAISDRQDSFAPKAPRSSAPKPRRNILNGLESAISATIAPRAGDYLEGVDERKLTQKALGDRYGKLVDNAFLSPWESPLSTFSVDVDTASYTNMRKMIQNGQSVPTDAVRIEEMVNYFNYSYPQPEGKHPFSVHAETASCPWNTEHRLVKVGLQGKDIIREQRPAANLVFLLDVSGSMNSHDKLPLLVDSVKILLEELNADDSVSIVVYAGSQGLALPPTYVDDEGRKTILEKLSSFSAGGSTNGGSGITLAYKMAKKHFVKGGVNRVILGTDGDFNVGLTDHKALVSMVEREAKSGVFLSVLGLGSGNLNDAMLEDITNKGNGNYSYIDSLREGRKVFLDDMMGNLVTIAKDVKIQVEFNPAKVKSYRLIGYANRMLKPEDFKNKTIDAGEIGAGHTVTALYEIVPGNAKEAAPVVDDLEYQKNKAHPKPAERTLVDNPHMLTLKLAYKGPEATKETESTYFKTRVKDSDLVWTDASDDFKFASGVALFGMLQRSSEHVGEGSYDLVRDLAEKGRGKDEKGHRTEFSDLVRKAAQ